MEEMKRNCELCNGEASIYCSSDNAFLCYSCDSKVHCANFLVARHVRSLICPCCRKFHGNRFSGAGVSLPARVACRNCFPPTTEDECFDVGVGGDDDDDSLSSCSSCVSSTGEGGGGVDEGETTSMRKKVDGSRRKKRMKKVVDLKVEGVLVNWCRRLGFAEEREVGQVVSMAVELMTGCLDRITLLPFRVALAASFWVAVRVCRRGGNGLARCCSSSSDGAACQDLKRVEQISGVPAKLILATEAKLARELKRRRSRESHEEGWAEC